MRLLEMSISAGIMILLVLLIRVMGKRYISKTAIICLWDMILLRALLPLQIPLEYIPMIKKSEDKLPAFYHSLNMTEVLQSSDIGKKPLDTVPQVQGYMRGLDLEEYLMIIWLAGVICMAVYFAAIYRKDYRKLRDIIPVQNETAERLIRYKSVRRKIRLYASEYFSAPVTCGVLRPKIVIPEVQNMISRTDLKNMIAHELVHIQRYDVAKRYLLTVVLCVHWFNPLVWLMYCVYREDQEMACDEQVLRTLGKQGSKNYIYTMIKMASRGDRLLATSGFGGKDHGRRRILAAINQKRMGKGGILAVTAAGLCLILFFVSLSPKSAAVSVTVNETKQEAIEKIHAYKVETERISPVLEGRREFPELNIEADFDYGSVMKDIEENYNDLTQPLTEEQELALRIQRLAHMAKRYKEWGEMGEKLGGYELWLIEKFYKYDKEY